MNTGVTRYVNSPSRSALRGKCTQRNFWMGDCSVDSWLGFSTPPAVGNASRFFNG
jgi:hypothetical protein